MHVCKACGFTGLLQILVTLLSYHAAVIAILFTWLQLLQPTYWYYVMLLKMPGSFLACNENGPGDIDAFHSVRQERMMA
jgi:hypothetical protein